MHRWGVLLTLGALAVCGATSAATLQEMVAAISAADADCQAAHLPSRVALANCLNTSERVVWVRDAPEGLPYFDEWAAQRLRITTAFEAKEMTLDEATSEMNAHQAVFRSQIDSLSAEEVASRQRAEEARRVQQERNDRTWAAIGYFAHAQAQAAQDRAAAAQREFERLQNQHSHTRCQNVFGQLDCTTTPW